MSKKLENLRVSSLVRVEECFYGHGFDIGQEVVVTGIYRANGHIDNFRCAPLEKSGDPSSYRNKAWYLELDEVSLINF